MPTTLSPTLFYVVKAEDLLALNYLPVRFPRPTRIEWINRATDGRLSPSMVGQLLRTYHRTDPSPSVVELRQASGVRAIFDNEADRQDFARLFDNARRMEQRDRENRIIAIFQSMDEAESAARRLLDAGMDETTMSFLWRANAFLEEDHAPPEGHTKGQVATRIVGGGVAGLAMGAVILVLPGLGPVIAAGGVLASTYSSVAAACGILGATSAALATMATDLDVDDFCYNHLEEHLKRGRIFLAIDTSCIDTAEFDLRRSLEAAGGCCVW